MNCVNHPDLAAIAYCRSCGKALCETCQRPVMGTVFCAEHVPAPAPPPPGPADVGYSPYTAPPPPLPGADIGASPGLAFLLGLIPGVGAIYNSQYVKGLVHVIILGLLISIVSSDAAGGFEPLFGMLIGVWVFYMAFEAYHTARKRQMGQPVDEFSSLVPVSGSTGAFPIAPVILIALGVFFLLNTMDIIRFSQVIRYWPVVLILLGAYMLYARLSGSPNDGPSHSGPSHPGSPIPSEASHERR
jgi:hypothetical protein